jgi:hypothetical protein
MAERYVMSETLGYCTKYMQRFQGTSRRVLDDKEEQFMHDEVVQGSGWARPMSNDFRARVHDFVITNSEVLKDWRL